MAERSVPVELPYTTLAELYLATGIAKSALAARARRNSWPYAVKRVAGGRQHQFVLDKLPAELQATVHAFRRAGPAVDMRNPHPRRARMRQRAYANRVWRNG